MQERVDLNVPLGLNDCTIRTFHGFAAELLQQFAAEIQLSRTRNNAQFEILTSLRM
jgi:superfamily I DNA/RNA helicase